MELNEKLQKLRKERGITQEELAQALFVSRTAVSKWESGRGVPNVDSLKALARYFSVSVDELLSGEEIIAIAKDEIEQKQGRFCDLAYGLLDCCALLYFLLPFFAQDSGGVVQAVPLPGLTEIAPYLKGGYFALTIAMAAVGILFLALKNCCCRFWVQNKYRLSLLVNGSAVLLYIAGRQPYAAVFAAVFLAVKAWLAVKRP